LAHVAPTEIISTDKFNNLVSHQYHVINDIKMNLMENSRQIKFLREGLNSSIDYIEMIMKYCDMMNNQTKKMFSLQNKLYENLLANEKQVCGLNTSRG
jgi:hypothetical protein